MREEKTGRKLFLQDIIDKLKKRGYRLTNQRVLIIDTFLKMKGHVSAEDIFEEIQRTLRKKMMGKIGLATIYRTMGMLKSIGVAVERNFGDGRVRYELISEHHDHLICQECGKVVEFFSPEIEEAQSKIAKKFGFILKSHRHELIGICPDCAKKMREIP